MMVDATSASGAPYTTALLNTVGMLPPDRVAWLRRTVLPLPGWCDPDKAVRLADLVIASTARLSVDLGVFGARSTLALAEGHRYLGYGTVTGVDPWTATAAIEGTNDLINDDWWVALDLEAIYEVAVSVMRRHADIATWLFQRQHSLDAASSFIDGTIDVLHQDSNHSPEVSQAELVLWLPKMRPKAYWIMDDTEWPSLQETQMILTRDHGATLVEDWKQWRVYQLP